MWMTQCTPRRTPSRPFVCQAGPCCLTVWLCLVCFWGLVTELGCSNLCVFFFTVWTIKHCLHWSTLFYLGCLIIWICLFGFHTFQCSCKILQIVWINSHKFIAFRFFQIFRQRSQMFWFLRFALYIIIYIKWYMICIAHCAICAICKQNFSHQISWKQLSQNCAWLLLHGRTMRCLGLRVSPGVMRLANVPLSSFKGHDS